MEYGYLFANAVAWFAWASAAEAKGERWWPIFCRILGAASVIIYVMARFAND